MSSQPFALSNGVSIKYCPYLTIFRAVGNSIIISGQGGQGLLQQISWLGTRHAGMWHVVCDLELNIELMDRLFNYFTSLLPSHTLFPFIAYSYPTN